MRNLLKFKKGFTLVEIVIVIAIIGILAMTLIPAVADTLKSRRLQASTEKARSVANLMLSGIESGQIPTTDGQKAIISSDVANAKLVTSTEAQDENGIPINEVYGIDRIYNNPNSNADLKDPMSRDVHYFSIRFNSATKTISILGADPDGSTNKKQLYVTTSPLTIFTAANS